MEKNKANSAVKEIHIKNINMKGGASDRKTPIFKSRFFNCQKDRNSDSPLF